MHTKAKKGILTGTIALAVLGSALFLLAETPTSKAYFPRIGSCRYINEIETCTRVNPVTGICSYWECKDVDELARVQGLTRSNIETVEKVRGVIENIVGWMQIFFYIVATLLMILAAWDYLNSGGDETKTKAAKNKVLYSLVAIAVAVIAGGIVTLVKNFVG